MALVAKDESDLAELASSLQSPGSSSDNELVTTLSHFLNTLTCENDPLWLMSAGLNDAEMKKVGIGKGDKVAVSNSWLECTEELIGIQLAGLWKMIRKKSAIFIEDELVSSFLLRITVQFAEESIDI